MLLRYDGALVVLWMRAVESPVSPGSCSELDSQLRSRFTLAALPHSCCPCSCSVGAHVRDAAAYVLWAFARAYTPGALGDAASHLAPALITLACYDREVNCRRAAAAAFQVGPERVLQRWSR